MLSASLASPPLEVSPVVALVWLKWGTGWRIREPDRAMTSVGRLPGSFQFSIVGLREVRMQALHPSNLFLTQGWKIERAILCRAVQPAPSQMDHISLLLGIRENCH